MLKQLIKNILDLVKIKFFCVQEINKYRLQNGLHALNPEDLDYDGEPDHLTATKHKIDDYLAKQVGMVCGFYLNG